MNTLYENGLRNDKLVLIYEETRNAKIAVKISSGVTKRINIANIIMQGTVFGSLICTSVIDKWRSISLTILVSEHFDNRLCNVMVYN